MNPFDQNARFAAKSLDPPGFLRWLLPAAFDSRDFRGWLDTRALPFPGEQQQHLVSFTDPWCFYADPTFFPSIRTRRWASSIPTRPEISFAGGRDGARRCGEFLPRRFPMARIELCSRCGGEFNAEVEGAEYYKNNPFYAGWVRFCPACLVAHHAENEAEDRRYVRMVLIVLSVPLVLPLLLFVSWLFGMTPYRFLQVIGFLR